MNVIKNLSSECTQKNLYNSSLIFPGIQRKVVRSDLVLEINFRRQRLLILRMQKAVQFLPCLWALTLSRWKFKILPIPKGNLRSMLENLLTQIHGISIIFAPRGTEVHSTAFMGMGWSINSFMVHWIWKLTQAHLNQDLICTWR